MPQRSIGLCSLLPVVCLVSACFSFESLSLRPLLRIYVHLPLFDPALCLSVLSLSRVRVSAAVFVHFIFTSLFANSYLSVLLYMSVTSATLHVCLCPFIPYPSTVVRSSLSGLNPSTSTLLPRLLGSHSEANDASVSPPPLSQPGSLLCCICSQRSCTAVLVRPGMRFASSIQRVGPCSTQNTVEIETRMRKSRTCRV